MQDTQQKANWSSKFKSPEIHIIYLWEGVQPVKILYVEKPHHCFVSLKIRQPKIYLRSFYDLLWMIYSFYNLPITLSQWCHIKERKKMT